MSRPVLEVYVPAGFALWPVAETEPYCFLPLSGALAPAEVGTAVRGAGVVGDPGPLGELPYGELACQPGARSGAAGPEAQLPGPYVGHAVRSVQALMSLAVRVLYGRCTDLEPCPSKCGPS